MFGVALGIKPEHFYQLRSDKKALLTGLFCQYILLPLITVALIYVLMPLYNAKNYHKLYSRLNDSRIFVQVR